MPIPDYEFLKQAGKILNSGQSQTILMTGMTQDLFFLPNTSGGEYVPLVSFLTHQWSVPGHLVVVYELNGPIRFSSTSDREQIKDAWLKLRTGFDSNELAIERMIRGSSFDATLEMMRGSFESNLERAIGRPTLALEVLRQMCLCSRTKLTDQSMLTQNLIIIVEAADMLIPEAPLVQLSDADRHRVAICQDWFSDPGFCKGRDAVVLLSESRSLINHRIAQMPQMLEVQVRSADDRTREHLAAWHDTNLPGDKTANLAIDSKQFVELTAGLSIHALCQLLKGAAHDKAPITQANIVSKVESYIQGQLGEDIVEFKKPSHTLDDVVGFSQLKTFLKQELMPRFASSGRDALPGAAVCGPIGSGKTYIFEAVAAELGMVVLILKNIRSQWFGQTDVIFERLRRVLQELHKVLIFVDEADTQFGSVGPDAHPTERRLTGKIQAMMSDTTLRGRVVWLLMTARIHHLSPDIRRPGRTGDLIIPVLDPEGEDRIAFLRWCVERVLETPPNEETIERLEKLTVGYSAASFASLRSELKAKAVGSGYLTMERIVEIASDLIPPAIDVTRRYQTLQALVNCTRRSLLPDPTTGEKQRQKWNDEIRALERMGIH